jgi:hypothetical protein
MGKEMSPDEQLRNSGQIVKEYAAAKALLANLMHEMVSMADACSGFADHIRKSHATAYADAPDIERLPDPGKARGLAKEIAQEFQKKARLADSLRALGVNVEEDTGFLNDAG